jgi:hypothetical protein
VASAALIVTNPGDLAMTVMNQRTSERILLPRVNSDAFWETVRDYYAHEDSRCWKFLAMFALHTTAGPRLAMPADREARTPCEVPTTVR